MNAVFESPMRAGDKRAPEAGAVTWHVDDVAWTPLTGLFIKKAGYKTVVPAEFSNDAYSIELTTVGPGGASPTHVEPHAHVFYVLSGHGEVVVGEEVRDVRPGSVSPISAGVPHSFRNMGGEALEMLVIYHPPRKRIAPPIAALRATVHARREEAQGVVSLELRPVGGGEFPAFEPGAHIDLHLPEGMVRSYSLCNSPQETHRYVIGVQRDRASRGGSAHVHDHLRTGDEIEISRPRNNFPLQPDAVRPVFIAGGIGITPILSMLRELQSQGRSADLLYAVRSRREAAFVKEIASLAVDVTWHFDDEKGGPPDLRRYLSARAGADVHYYACGPGAMLDTFEALCSDLAYEHVHVERFVARKPTQAAEPLRHGYAVELRRSGMRIEVPPGKTLLNALLDAGVEIGHSCKEGVCGACKTRVLSGEPDHRDSVLSAAERAAGAVMTPCVSGCRKGPLVLDL